jgi:putative ATP-binding cassette transporter
MTLLELLTKEAGDERRRLIVAANVAGIANVALLASVNVAVQLSSDEQLRALILFVLLIALYALCALYTGRRTSELIEAGLHRIKVRVGERIAKAELEALERVKAAEICDRITENTTFITERSGAIATMMQSMTIMVFAIGYVAWLSPPAFALVGLLCGAGAMMFVLLRREFVVHVQQTARQRITFFERLADMLSGSKEIRFSRRRSREVREDIIAASDALRAAGTKSSNLMADGMLLGEGVLFALLTAVVYVLRSHVEVDARLLTRLVAAVMFIWGPFMGLTLGVLPYIRSNIALGQIDALEQKLEAALQEEKPEQKAEDPWKGRVTAIEARDIEYSYPADNGGERFHIGPLSLTLEAGQIVFIVGGNGSGKSTFLKVLTGLYAPSAGSLRASGVAVGRENVVWFRDMISAIFSDFHLFTKLYGLAGVEEEAVHRLLALMQLEEKTSFAHRKFTKLTLSTGQRKRIAMVVALLEDRPICVFDEWAADQDVQFRRYFYEELLPSLRRAGKLVIVVSHDDRYFHCADRVIKMEYGKIRSIEEPRAAQAAP